MILGLLQEFAVFEQVKVNGQPNLVGAVWVAVGLTDAHSAVYARVTEGVA
jgi:hypothetical protein